MYTVTRKHPKAYYAYEKDSDCATIVFAASATQAKTIAKSCEIGEDARYIDLRVRRMPEADSLYTGYGEVDWYNPKIRISLVRDLGWDCFGPSFECDTCQAKPYCKWHGKEDDE